MGQSEKIQLRKIYAKNITVFGMFPCFSAPNNTKPDPNSYYTLFIRVYVKDNLYTSTDWYTAVLTLKSEDDPASSKRHPKTEVKCEISKLY